MRSARYARTAALVLIVLCATLGATEARPTALDRSNIRYPLPSSPPPAPSAYSSSPSPYAAPYGPTSFSPSPSAYASSPPAYGLLQPPSSTYGSSPAGCGLSYFSSYIDDTGIDAPDGPYKQTCADVSYDASTDVLRAECSSDAKLRDSASSGYTTTTLNSACQCTTNIANNDGVLECVRESALVSVAPASDDCSPLLVLYKSKLDKTGDASPDGNYKETCGDISYNCQTDTISASCTNSQGELHPDPQSYAFTSYARATECSGNLGNDAGSLFCSV
ncbi:hypothetical protein ABBQ32_011392 [Trebouxia sp. C0010 RCD-2024]